MVVVFFLLLRPSRTAEALKKGSYFGFLTLKYALKNHALDQACMKKRCPVSKRHGGHCHHCIVQITVPRKNTEVHWLPLLLVFIVKICTQAFAGNIFFKSTTLGRISCGLISHFKICKIITKVST